LARLAQPHYGRSADAHAASLLEQTESDERDPCEHNDGPGTRCGAVSERRESEVGEEDRWYDGKRW
jgi:hypothetical protein